MIRLESIKTNQELAGKERLTDLVARLDNDHCRVGDLQTMVHSNQQRIEQLYEMIKGMENSVMNFNVVEESHDVKIVGRF